MKVLIVVDMQVDFVTGSLGSKDAQDIVDNVVNRVAKHDGAIIFTRDTHSQDYMTTLEGKKLPVAHCIENTNGWQIIPQLRQYVSNVVDKPTFGSTTLPQMVSQLAGNDLQSITLIGLCTDICVISNAMYLKANFPNTPIIIESHCCAGISKESHNNALNAMKMCHIDVI